MTTMRTATMQAKQAPRQAPQQGPRAVHTPTAQPRRATAVLAEELRCGCGQELDCCAGDHCPRCGHDLRHRA